MKKENDDESFTRGRRRATRSDSLIASTVRSNARCSLRKTSVRRAWRNSLDDEQWKANPVYRVTDGFAIDDVWAIVRNEMWPRWILTHQPTGFAASYSIRTKAGAVQAVATLYRKFGRKAWTFTDPAAAKKFAGGAKQILAKYDDGLA